jgi:hypothetical protein
MSKLWKMPFAALSALAVLVLAPGTANAAEDPVSTVVGCVVDLVSGGCPPPAALAPPVPGGATDAGDDAGSDSAAPASGNVLGDVVGGALGSLPGPSDQHTPPAAGTDTTDDQPADETADETDGGSAGGLLATACDALPEIPAIPGLGSLTDVTCEQLPAVVCPPLLSHPDIPGLAEVAELLLCAAPNTAPPAGGEPYYENCDAARAAGAAPIQAGQPGYRPGLDRDSDGVACEASEDTGAAVVPVSAPTPPVAVVGGTGRLAYTGLELSPQLGSAGALLALGSGLLLAARRRS